jgi:hypothetical protein
MTMTQTQGGQEAGRPQPQTTTEAGGGPFIRSTQPGNLPQFVTPSAFGGLVQQPLVARPGYYRDFRLLFTGQSGSGATTVASTADGIYAIAALIQFKDPFGTLIFSVPSFEAALIGVHSGGAGCGLGLRSLQSGMPSFAAMVVGASASGNFQWPLTLPLEFAKGIGTSPGANAALQPTLTIQLNPASSIYSTAPTVPPSLVVGCESDFYWLPEGNDVAPPALGTSRQWILQQANPPISSGGNQRAAFPRLGGYLDTMIIELRDSAGARVAGFPIATIPGTAGGRFTLYIDGVPIEDTPMWKLYDDYFITYGNNCASGTLATNPLLGTYTFSRKTSLNQETNGLLDTAEATLSTNPGTLIEIAGSPWGTIGASPATVNVIVGQIVPRGRMVQGLPEI